MLDDLLHRRSGQIQFAEVHACARCELDSRQNPSSEWQADAGMLGRDSYAGTQQSRRAFEPECLQRVCAVRRRRFSQRIADETLTEYGAAACRRDIPDATPRPAAERSRRRPAGERLQCQWDKGATDVYDALASSSADAILANSIALSGASAPPQAAGVSYGAAQASGCRGKTLPVAA